MNAGKLLEYIGAQKSAIEALVSQLDEVQVAFNAQFDQFKARHDETLDRLSDQVAAQLEALDSSLRAAVDDRLREERQQIVERRQKVREEYLPLRQQAADELLGKAQAELAELRKLNPELNDREEELKREKARLESRLTELNEEIRKKSRGLGLLLHFRAITQADRKRNRVLGRLEGVNEALRNVRTQWEEKRREAEGRQAGYQEQWQLESIAVARLQSELDQLEDEALSEDLALRRAIRHVLDALKELPPSPAPELRTGLEEMVQLNIQTDDYHEGLASVGGLIGLLGGINSGLEAIAHSIEGLQKEQEMHSAYLKALDFDLPSPVEAFHGQWPALAEQFADEKTIGGHPADFSAAVQPLLAGPLSQANIEAMFGHLGEAIKKAAAAW